MAVAVFVRGLSLYKASEFLFIKIPKPGCRPLTFLGVLYRKLGFLLFKKFFCSSKISRFEAILSHKVELPPEEH